MLRLDEILGEIHRRKVGGTILLYGGVAWLSIEVITVLTPVFDGPDWIVRAGVVMVLLGLPVAVALSWWFDFNPRTMRLEASPGPRPMADNARVSGSALAHWSGHTAPVHGAAAAVQLQAVATEGDARETNELIPLGAPLRVQPPSRRRRSNVPTTVHQQDSGTPGRWAARRPTRHAAIAGALVLLLLGAVGAHWGRGLMSPAGAGIATIAVLPFVDTSPHADNEYLADGLTDELINKLAQIAGLRVAARTSSFAYKGREVAVRQISEELGVGVVLEGSIRQEGNQLRIYAQLVNAADGYNLWAMSYERSRGEIFTVQAEIVLAVTQQLRAGPPQTTSDPVRGSTDNVEAYHDYLRGRYFWHRRDDLQRREENLRTSLDYFQRALAADPTFALAYAGLADSYASLAGRIPREEAYSKAREAALQAVRHDETLAEGHVALARVLVFQEWDWAGAGRAYRRAIYLSPSYATARQWYAMYLLHLGEGDEALREVRLAQRLDPLSVSVNSDVGRVLYSTRRYNEAVTQWRNILALDPNYADARLYLGLTYLEKGMFQEAKIEFERWGDLRQEAPNALLAYAHASAGDRAEAQRLLELVLSAEQTRPPAAAIALIYGQLGDLDNAFHWLDRAVEQRSSFLLFIKVSPRVDPLRSDARYEQLLRRIGLAP